MRNKSKLNILWGLQLNAQVTAKFIGRYDKSTHTYIMRDLNTATNIEFYML
jgi:hypothetical protein